MEKRILLTLSALLAFTGQVHANAAILNAASRFLVTGASIGGAGLYAAEKHPVAFDRVSYLVSGPANQTPMSQTTMTQPQAAPLTELQITEMVSKGVAEGLKSAPQSPTTTNNGAGNSISLQQICMKAGALIAALAVYDHLYGHQYTQRMIKVSADFMQKKFALVWKKLKGIETKVDGVSDQVQQLTYEQRKANLKSNHEASKAVLERKALNSKLSLINLTGSVANNITLLKAQREVDQITEEEYITKLKKCLLECKPGDKNINWTEQCQTIDNKLAENLQQLKTKYEESLQKLEQEKAQENSQHSEQREQERGAQDDEQMNQSFKMPNSGLYNKAASLCSTAFSWAAKVKFW